MKWKYSCNNDVTLYISQREHDLYNTIGTVYNIYNKSIWSCKASNFSTKHSNCPTKESEETIKFNYIIFYGI